MKEHYLDNSATTPLTEKVREKMTDIMENCYGNPSSLHTLGANAEKELTDARNRVLHALCPPKSGIRLKEHNLIFTASGSEANNLAIIGFATAKARNAGKKIIIGETEHPSVRESAAYLATLGYKIVKIPSPNGVWDYDTYKKEMDKDTILVSAMLVNNETGAVNDIKKIAEIAREKNPDVYVHCDAVQGFLKVPVYPIPHADMVTVSAHKIGGPKGVGALYINDRVLKAKAIRPVIFGGGQEKNYRSGTENVIGIAGFGIAAEEGAKQFGTIYANFTSLRSYLEEKLAAFPENTVRINRPQTEQIAPHIVSLTVFGVRSETLLHFLSMSHVYVSSGSACSSNDGHASYVLHSFGVADSEADSTVRISMGGNTDKDDIDALINALQDSITKLARKYH